MAVETDGLAKKYVGACILVWSLALSGCQSGSAPAAKTQGLRQPDKGLVTATLASAAERSGDLVSAQGFYGQLIASGNASGQIYERRGEILLTLGAPNEAAAVFAAALKAGYDSPIIRRGNGRALAWLSRPEAALVQYDSALASNPLDVKAMNGRGVCLDMLGRHDAAQAQYKSAMALASTNQSIQNNQAMSYALSGKVPEAIDILERIYASGTSTIQHRQNLALLYGLLGKTEKAQALASQDLSPDDVASNMATYATMQVLFDAEQSTSVAMSQSASPAAAAVSAPARPTAATPEAKPSGQVAAQPMPAVPAAPPPAAPPDGAAPASSEKAVEAAAPPAPPAQASTSSQAAGSPASPATVAEAGPTAPVAAPAAQSERKSQPVRVRQPWVVDLGVFETDVAARDVWQQVRQQAKFAQAVHYLEPEGIGRRLLAGPFWGDEDARGACLAVRGAGLACEPRQASAVRTESADPPPADSGQP
ncbi:tetratricopeptide repeat protein [Emcibacter sp. SYSU 3D8]|uniref:tetratricopeptide repeat protein n=1 Tax=Emcibacter sp. SYSU 3D8 TaxID=3133969 RepID=UPI0031FED855